MIHNTGYLYAIVSAILFGASTPAAKYLLHEIDPWILAGLLYLSSGLGLLVIFLIRPLLTRYQRVSKFKVKDWKWLLGSSLFGGILAPVLLLFGLVKTPATVTSLLLTLESVFTALLAWIVFKEATDRKNVLAVLLIILGSIILAWKSWLILDHLLGTTLISLACLCWAIDNNMLLKISSSDPVMIISIKSIIAGITNLILGIMIKGTISLKPSLLVESAIIGLICYGLSMYFFILSLRHIGAARTGAYYSLAPFIGVALSALFLKEILSFQIILAGAIMAIGVSFHIIEVLEQKRRSKNEIFR